MRGTGSNPSLLAELARLPAIYNMASLRGRLALASGIQNAGTVRLNHGAANNARSLIEAGKYDDDSAWSFSAEDGDKLLGPNGDNWAEYRKWFLGESDGPSNEKGSYHYPYGKDGKVYGQALRAIRSRAAQQGATEVFDEAGKLLDLLNGKTGDKSNRLVGPYYTMKAAGQTGEIMLYGDIGPSFWSDGLMAEDFAKDLKALGKVNQLDVRINSAGGSVFEGFAIYSLLDSHPAKKTAYVDGLAASIASVVAMACDEIRMPSNSFMMIHNAWGGASGYAADLRKTAATLDKITGQIADTYARRTGVALAQVSKMMDDETWMTGEEAKANGFCDVLTDAVQAAACAVDPTRFKHMPRALAQQQAAMPRRDRFAARFQRLQTNKIRGRRSGR